MSDPPRIYTVAEANALLPHLAPTLVELREKYEEAVKVRALIDAAASTNGGSTRREEWATLMARVDELLDRLTGWDIVLRDVSSGLIDFLGIVQGQEAWLCWRLGEPEVAWWHPLDEGFASRRPLGSG